MGLIWTGLNRISLYGSQLKFMQPNEFLMNFRVCE